MSELLKVRPESPEYKKRFVPGKTVVYMFLPQVEPACNARCTGCYVFASGAYPDRVQKSEEEIVRDLKGLTAAGYSVILSTTEILMMKRYLDILQAVNASYVLTNGRIIASRPEILEELRGIGIKQIVMTANFQNSGLALPNPNFFRRAVDLIKNVEMEVMVRITLTKDNLENIFQMVKECYSLGIRSIQFLRFIPLEKGPDTLNEADTKRVFDLIRYVRADFPEVFISAGGTLGSQFREKEFACPAGKTQFTIGLDNKIYPCIFITQPENAIGDFKDGELRIDRQFNVEGNPLDCPAYIYSKTKKMR